MHSSDRDKLLIIFMQLSATLDALGGQEYPPTRHYRNNTLTLAS